MENSNNQMHNITSSDERMKTHKCEICDKEFKSKQGFHKHFHSIHNEPREIKYVIFVKKLF